MKAIQRIEDQPELSAYQKACLAVDAAEAALEAANERRGRSSLDKSSTDVLPSETVRSTSDTKG